jgi:zinc protease
VISRRWIAFILMAFLTTPSASAADKVFPYPHHTKILPNGLTVVMIPMPSPGLISFFSIVRTGSRDEVAPGKSGFAHFFEHMMFRGTKKYPGPEHDRIVASLGAKANAMTTDDLTLYHLTFAKDDLEKVIEIESDRFQNLDYGKPAFETEAGAIYGEYRIAAAQPWFALEEKLQGLAYDAHPYKHTTMGFEADVKAMPTAYDFSLDFYRRFYRPDNVVLLVVGDVDSAATMALIEKYYGSWEKGYRPAEIPPEPPQTAPRSAEVDFPGRTLPILAVAYKGDAFDPDNLDYAAARLLGQLAFGPQSDLYKKLVLREQKVEMLLCDIPVNRDQPLFSIVAMVKKPEDVDVVRNEIDRTLEQFKTEPVDPQKLADLKRRERYAFVMQMDTPDKTAMNLARYVAATGGIEAVDRLFAASDKITPQDIMRAAAKYFIPQRRTTVVLKEKGAKVASPGPGTSVPSNKKGSGDRGQGSGDRGQGTGDRGQGTGDRDQGSDSSNRKLEISNLKSPISDIKSPPLDPKSFVLLPEPNDPTISLRIWFKTGSQYDPPGKAGLSAITAAMIGQASTQSRDYEEILDLLFPLAAKYSDQPGTEMTVISARVHRDNLDRFYPLLIEAIQRPAFLQKDLDRIKSQTLNYLQNTLRFSSDEELGKVVLYNAIFAGTPYGHLTEGTVSGVQDITLDDVRDFYRRHFTRENVVVGVGGGYNATLLEKLRTDLGRLPSIAAPPVAPPDPAPIRGRRVTLVEKDCGATAISAGFPIDVLRGSREWYALALANSWLGQHRNQNGHLYQVIREARGLNYGDYTYIERFPNGTRLLEPPVNVCLRRQIFELWIRPVPHAARQFALRAAIRELQNLIDRGMTHSEFDASRTFLRKYVLHLAPTTMDRLGYALDDRFYGIEGSHLETFRRIMDELTLDEVNAAIKKHLQCENLEIAMITKDAQGLKAALVADAPSPITYPTPKPDSVLAEDREISVFPLKIGDGDVRIVPVAELFEK